MMKFYGADDLERSGIVANCRMNRERNLTGSNGYSTDLGFNPLSLIEERNACQDHVRWLDLCCVSGKALSSKRRGLLESNGCDNKVEIVGVDLVGQFLDLIQN